MLHTIYVTINDVHQQLLQDQGGSEDHGIRRITKLFEVKVLGRKCRTGKSNKLILKFQECEYRQAMCC